MPSGAPIDIRAEAKSSTELVVTWEPPSRETWNGNLLGYHVGYQEVSSEETNNVAQSSYTFKSVEVRPHFGGEAVLQGLSKYTTYGIIVQVGDTPTFITPRVISRKCLLSQIFLILPTAPFLSIHRKRNTKWELIRSIKTQLSAEVSLVSRLTTAAGQAQRAIPSPPELSKTLQLCPLRTYNVRS